MGCQSLRMHIYMQAEVDTGCPPFHLSFWDGISVSARNNGQHASGIQLSLYTGSGMLGTVQSKHALSTDFPSQSVSGNLGKEPSLRHQAERKLVTGIVQEVFELQEGHTTQLPPVPPVNPDLQLTGLYGEDQAD